MSIPLDIFLADPIVTSTELPPFRRKTLAYVYRLLLDRGKTDQELLEDAFRVLNIHHPSDYRARSLSVGDVVTIDRRRSYRCAMVGWQQLEQPLLRRHGRRALVQGLRVHWNRWKPEVGRFLCQLQGCATLDGQACVRCSAFIYDPNFLPGPRWLHQLSERWRSLRRRCVHRCAVCDHWIWFSETLCCSDACFEDWFPF